MITVPLVVYANGERKVIGQATVDGDVVSGVIDPSYLEDVERSVKINGGEFSIHTFPNLDRFIFSDNKKEN